MLIKIFFPEHLFYTKENCNLFGEITVQSSVVTYFIILGRLDSCTKRDSGTPAHILKHFQHLGKIQYAGETMQARNNMPMVFAYDDNFPHIYLLKLGNKTYSRPDVNLFIYDSTKVLKLQMQPKNVLNIESPLHDIHMLYNILDENEKNTRKHSWKLFGVFASEPFFAKCYDILIFPLEIMTKAFVLVMEMSLVRRTLRRMTIYEHYNEWKHFRNSGEMNFNLTVDRTLGICGMLLLYSIPQPEQYIKQASQEIIALVRLLLINLKGNPIGLKLNTHLNNFLLDSFNYHINLWDNFLELMGPFVQQVFVLTTFFGSMGLSFQLAIFTDLISILGVHAHCFYVYTSVLYRASIEGLQVLWKVGRGKRFNVLKNRVESHNYDNRQLYLSTILFSSLFFLFPTVLTYYGVFTFLRLIMFFEKYIIQLLRCYILEFPTVAIYKWLKNEFYKIDGIRLQRLNYVAHPHFELLNEAVSICVFKLEICPSSLIHVLPTKSRVVQKFLTSEDSIWKVVFYDILKGKF